jgi:hypothetical protein
LVEVLLFTRQKTVLLNLILCHILQIQKGFVSLQRQKVHNLLVVNKLKKILKSC